MELKKGYKQTEVGVIPENWTVLNVQNITLDHKQGYYTNKGYVDSGTYLVRITDLLNPKISYEGMPKLVISKRDFELFRIKKGDFLFARSGSIGRYGIVYEDVEAIFGSFIIRFNFNTKKISNEFFGFLYGTDSVLRQLLSITQGSSNININANNIKAIKIPVPPLPEQHAIATALSDVDSLLTALDSLIAKKRLVKQGAMQELLTGKRRLVGYSKQNNYRETDFGLIPEDWKIIRLGDVATLGRGRVISHREINASSSSAMYPVFSSQTTNDGIMGFLDNYDFEGEYITWTTDGANAGAVFYHNGRFNCTNVCGTIKLKEHHALFISYALSTVTRPHVATNLANPKLMNGVVKKISFPIPPTIAEQQAIAEILSDMDAEINALESRREKTRQLKAGMMQELLTGRIRLL